MDGKVCRVKSERGGPDGRYEKSRDKDEPIYETARVKDGEASRFIGRRSRLGLVAPRAGHPRKHGVAGRKKTRESLECLRAGWRRRHDKQQKGFLKVRKTQSVVDGCFAPWVQSKGVGPVLGERSRGAGQGFGGRKMQRERARLRTGKHRIGLVVQEKAKHGLVESWSRPVQNVANIAFGLRLARGAIGMGAKMKKERGDGGVALGDRA